jgi:uncharacterized membrane protein YqhA
MLSTLFRIHYVAIVAVIGSLFGAILMMIIGGYNVALAFATALGIGEGLFTLGSTTEATGLILESIDNFLLGFILLYFAYSMYYLVTLPEERRKLGQVKMPSALKVESLDEMKRTILVVIVVSLSVFLLQEITISETLFDIPDLFVPASILAVALAVRLIPWDISNQVSDNNDDELE